AGVPDGLPDQDVSRPRPRSRAMAADPARDGWAGGPGRLGDRGVHAAEGLRLRLLPGARLSPPGLGPVPDRLRAVSPRAVAGPARTPSAAGLDLAGRPRGRAPARDPLLGRRGGRPPLRRAPTHPRPPMAATLPRRGDAAGPDRVPRGRGLAGADVGG